MAVNNAQKFGTGMKELKLGKTFNKGYSDESFHTLRYDFKPASVDAQKVGTLEVVDKEITLTVPTEGTHSAVFKGNKTVASKDCLLIINHETGEFVLERISQHVRVKKTRLEGSSKLSRGMNEGRPSKVSPLQNITHTAPSSKSPQTKSPVHRNIPPPIKSSQPAPGSMPMLNFEDDQKMSSIMSDSSSDSDSGSSSSSDSDSDSEPDTQPMNAASTLGNGKQKSPTSILCDLELSEED